MTRIRLSHIGLIFISISSYGQYKDAGMWMDFSVSAELAKKWSVMINPEVRMNENLSRASRIFSDVGFQYKVNKSISVGMVYRGGTVYDGYNYDPRQRIQIAVSFRKKIKDFSISWTPRWQSSIQSFSAESDADFVTTMRNKFQVKYSGIKRSDFATSFETFNSTASYQNAVLTNWRWTGTVERKLNKRNSITVGYLIQKSLLSSPQKIDYVFLLSYGLQLDFNKSDKSEKTKEPKKE